MESKKEMAPVGEEPGVLHTGLLCIPLLAYGGGAVLTARRDEFTLLTKQESAMTTGSSVPKTLHHT